MTNLYPSDHLLPDLHRCIDCGECSPLNLIGQTAICRFRRKYGKEHKIYDPYLMIRCNNYGAIIGKSGPSHQGESQGCDDLGDSGGAKDDIPRP